MKKFLFFLISILISIQAFAQVDVQIGTGTTNFYDPLPGWFGYNRSAYLYKATEINTAGIINSVAFQIQSASSLSTAKLKIYLLETSMTSMPGLSATNWNALKTGATLVYQSNAFAASPTGWKTIPLDLLFAYAGVDNLMVLIEGEGCSTSGGCPSQCYNHVSPASHWYFRTDTSAPNDNAGSTSSTGQEGNRANIKFNISPAGDFCYPPSQLTASNITTSSADFTWTTHTTGSSWVVQYKPTASAQWSTDDYAYSGTYSLQGLSATTSYDIRVKSICATNESGWNTISFMTACGAVTQFPWTEGFETSTWPAAVAPGNAAAPNCWLNFNTGTATGLWRSTTTAAYIHSGSASAQQYTGGTTSANNDWFISPTFTLTGNERLSFWTKGYSTYVDYIKVAIYDVTQNGHDVSSMEDTLLFTTIMPNTLLDLTNWVEHTIYLNDYIGDFRFAFVRDNLGYYINLDDITIETIPLCPQPLSTSVVLGQTETTINWLPADLSQNSFYLYTKLSTASVYDSVLVSGTSYILQNLTEGSTYNYYVKADCGSELSAPTAVKTFKTLCSVITTLPASEFFDTYSTGTSAYPTCWMRNSSNPGYPYISTTNVTSPGALYFYAYYANSYNIAISPMIDASIPIYSLKATLKMKPSGLDDTLYIGVMTDPYDVSTFEQVGFLVATTTTAFQDKEIYFNDYTGSGQFIAIKAAFAATSSTIYVDNVVLDLAPLCPNPTTLSVSGVTANQLSLTWIENGSATSWDIEYGAPGFTLGTGTQLFGVADNPSLIDGLDAQTAYQFYVKAVCGAGDESVWSSPITLTTACAAITTVPWTDNFDTYGTATFPTCWLKISTSTSYPAISSTHSSSPKSINLYSSSAGNYNYIITPMFDESIDISTLQAEFQIRGGIDDTLYIGVMSDPYDLSTFVLVDQVVPSIASTWEAQEVFFNNYVGGGNYIVFKNSYGATTSDIYFDDLEIFEIPSCPRPTNILFSEVYSSSAVASWTPVGTPDYYEVVFDTAGVDLLTASPIQVYDTFYQMDNLTAATLYHFYVRPVCSSEYGDWTNLETFTTACEAVTVFPYTENFDTYGTTAGTFPLCWFRPVVNSTYPSIVTAYSVSSPASLRFQSASADAPTYAITPQLDVDINTLRVLFKLKAESITSSGTIHVGVMSDPSVPSTFELVQIITPTTTNFTDYEVSFANTTLTGAGNYIAFKHVTVSYNYYYWLDDVVVSFIPTCPKPTGLVDYDSLITSNSITLDWDGADDSNVLSWLVEYKPLDDTIWQSQIADAHPFVLSGLESSVVYQIRIYANCSGDDISDPSATINVGMPCGSINTFPWTEGFESAWYVAYGLNTGTHPWCWTNINGGTQASGLWRKTITAAYVRSGTGSLQMYSGSTTAGLSGDYIITPAFTLSGNERITFWAKGYSTYTDILSVKIYDVSTNGIVNDAADTSLFVTILPNTTIPATTWTEYEINLSQFSGDYQIAFVRNTTGGFYLNIDDITIDAIPTCRKPTALAANSVTSNSVDLSWTEGGSETSWNVEYKLFTDATWTLETNVSNPHTVYSLLPSSSYQFRVQADCGGDLSIYTDPISVATLCEPITLLPWADSFESITAAATLPACWAATSFTSKTNTQIVNFSDYNRVARTGTRAAYFVWGCNDRFFTPAFDLQAGVAYQFSFWYITDATNAWPILQTGVYSAQNASTIFQTITTINNPNNTTYQEAVSYFTPPTDGVYYFGIYAQSPGTSGWYLTIDDISVDIAPDCLPVQNLAVTNVVGTSAYVSWLPSGTPDSYAIEVSEVGTGIWTPYYSTDPFYVLTGLSELTSYSVQVYPICSGIDGPRDTVNFATVCAAGGDIIIGTPAATTSTGGDYLPTNTWYEYSYTQQIFDAAEIGDLDSIRNISFQYVFTTPITRNLKIYLAHTSQSTFATTLDYIPFAALQLVYQGNVTFNNSGPNNWVTITLPLGFEYHADSNLVVAIHDISNNYYDSGDVKFKTHATNGNKAIYMFSDLPLNTTTFSTDPDATYYGKSVLAYRSNIKISSPCETVSCYQPNVILQTVTASSASMLIIPGGYETSWEGEYKQSTETTWTTLGTVSTSDFVLDNLSSNTTYQVRFRSVCSASDMSSWKVITFTTECGSIMQLPIIENFDTYLTGTGTYPTCWSTLSSSSSYPYISSTYNASPSNSFYFYAGAAGNYNYLITPIFDPSIELYNLKAELKLRVSALDDTLYVGVMEDPFDMTSFELVAKLIPSAISVFQDMDVFFNNYTGTGKYIAFKAIYSTTTTTMYMDNLKIDLIPTCPKPTQLAASAITENSANLTWTENGTAASWNIEYGPINFIQGSEAGTVVNATTNPFTLEDLNSSSMYDVYVQAICSPTDLSVWSSKVTFATSQIPASVPVNIDFETPSGFQFANNPTGNNWAIGTATFNGGANALYVSNDNGATNSYSEGTTTTVWAYRDIDFTASSTDYTLTFDWKANGEGAYETPWDYLSVYIGSPVMPSSSTDLTLPAGSVPIASGLRLQTTWQTASYILPAAQYSGQIKRLYFLWRNDSSGGAQPPAAIDNIFIVAPTCAKPTALVASTPTETSVTLAWTQSGTPLSWEVEYGAPGFTHGDGTIVSAATNPYIVTGLTDATIYDFYVRAICGVGDTSLWSNKVTFATSCSSFTLPFVENFDGSAIPVCWSQTVSGAVPANRWSLVTTAEAGGSANEMKNDSPPSSGTNGVSMLISPPIDFTNVSNATLTFKHLFHAYSGGGGVTLKIKTSSDLLTWTDQSFSYSSSAGDVGPVTVTVPLTLNSGINYVAWVMDGDHFSYFYWNIDNVNIAGATPLCDVPTGLAVSAITPTTATATWNAGTATSWQVAYKTNAATSWTTAIVSAASYNFTALTASTLYNVKVRAICALGDTSAYSAVVNFTTGNPACNMPTNLQVTNITDQSANATWTAGGTETSWIVEYKLVSSPNWTSASATVTSFPMVGLQSASNYEVRVKAVCSGTSESAFTNSTPFTTLGGTTFTITASSGANGTITPTGDITVTAGASKTFNFTPNTGYMISAVVVDNTPEATQPTSYTFTNVQANHTIHVDFITTGIEENELAQLVELFPNPTASTIELRLKSEQLHIKECRIYDMYGKLMRVLPITEETTTIDVTDFAAGVYFVRMESERGIISKKFVKK